MSYRAKTLTFTLLLTGAVACSGGGDPGSSSSSSGGGSSSSSGGSSSGGSSTSQATSCDIADAGSVANGAANPANACQVCDASQSATTWSPGTVCNLCHDASGSEGICTQLGNCCTIVCNNSCLVDGGHGAPCGSNSDCCGIPPNICT